MLDSLKSCLAQLPLTRLGEAAAVIGEVLGQGRGMRLGQSTVLSTKVHAFNSNCPEHVQIMINSDAGHFFYHRQDNGAIGHMDIFHECGEVDHRIAAMYICTALEYYQKLVAQQTTAMCIGVIHPDLVDIQTATGGGRITGSLQCGRKLSVRRVHENHVHVALQLQMNNLFGLFYIVAAVETAILDLGLEPRCNERIMHVATTDCLADLSPYTDQTDSQLIGQPANEHQAAMSGTSSCQAVDSPPGNVFPDNPDCTNSSTTGSRGQTVVCCKEPVNGAGKEASRQHGLTEYKFAAGFYSPGLYDSFKQAVSLAQNQSDKAKSRQWAPNYREAGGGNMACDRKNSSSGLDVTATVGAAAERYLTEEIAGRLRIDAQDVRFSVRRQRLDHDICLLIDSSGSMADLRLRAAGYLAGEISRFGCSRLGLMTFQDNQAAIMKPFTASRQAVLNAFAEIAPHGATPLALGIRRSLIYMKEQHANKPLLVLITDGIPSCRYDELAQPLTDALAAAAEIRTAHCGFLCIGLDQDDRFLKKLTAVAGGVMYGFPEAGRYDGRKE